MDIPKKPGTFQKNKIRDIPNGCSGQRRKVPPCPAMDIPKKPVTFQKNKTRDIPNGCSGQRRKKNGAPTGTRTQDPMIKSHLLYQLSYGRTT